MSAAVPPVLSMASTGQPPPRGSGEPSASTTCLLPPAAGVAPATEEVAMEPAAVPEDTFIVELEQQELL